MTKKFKRNFPVAISMVKICRVCGVTLTEENVYPSNLKIGNNICIPCTKKRAKEWREKNLEKVREYELTRRKRPPGYQAEISRRYRERHREKVRKLALERYYKNRERYKRKALERYNRLANEIRSAFGNKCNICGAIKTRLFLHEIHGLKHQKNIITATHSGRKLDNFVLLCNRCHKGVHFCLEILKINWEQVVSLIGER
ncbi:MAG: hypothetical protein QXW83_00615 [Nitrososphaerales archaeon]